MLQKLKKKETKMGLSIDFSIEKLQHPNLKFHDKTLLRILFC
jgi:hypothetical protein